MLTDNARVALRRRRCREMAGGEAGPLGLLEELLSGYLPDAKAERTRDARVRPALEIRMAGRPPWILTRATDALALDANQLFDWPSERSERCAA